MYLESMVSLIVLLQSVCGDHHQDFVNSDWTFIGTVNRWCSSELVCGGSIPICDASTNGKTVQDRISHNNCVAQECEGGTQMSANTYYCDSSRKQGFLSRGWSYIGNYDRFCSSQLDCSGSIPYCDSSTNGKTVQDRNIDNGCIAQGCEAGNVMYPRLTYYCMISIPPTKQPTKQPTKSPTPNPTLAPTDNPTSNPTKYPTKYPTKNPTNNPTSNPTQIPTDNPTSNPSKYPSKQPTWSPVDDGSSGEQYDSHTTEHSSFNKNDSSNDGFLNNNGINITSTYFIYIIVGAALLCCCGIGIIYIFRKLKQRKNDDRYLGPTDLVQITSISGKDDIITPIGKDNGNYSLDNNASKNSEAQIMEDIAEIVNGTTMGALQSDDENVDTQQLKEGDNDEEMNTLATPNGYNDNNVKQNNRTEVDTDSDIDNQNNVTTQGYNDNIAQDEFIINDQDIETDEGTTEEDQLDDPLDADNIAHTLDTKR